MGDQPRFWSNWRAHFRMCRICVLLLIFALVCAVLWLNQIGLPDFVKQPIVNALRQRGIAFQFVRLRLNFIHGLVADNVLIGGETPGSPSLSLQELHLQLDYGALLQRKLQLRGVVLRQGTFTLPLSDTNDPSSVLTISHIQTELSFRTNDVWTLDNFEASFAGARFILSGELTHADQATNWDIFHRTNSGAGQVEFKKIANTLAQIHFHRSSLVSLDVRGDALDANSFLMRLGVNALSAQTPWGSASNIVVVVHSITLTPKPGAALTSPVEINWKARLSNLQTEPLDADFISCDGFWNASDLQLIRLDARLGGGDLHARAQLNLATRELSFTNSSCFNLNAVAALLTSKTDARLDQFSFPQPPQLQASGSMILPEWANRAPDYWRTVVQPTIRLNGALAITNAAFNGVTFDQIFAGFSYSNEIWTLPDVVLIRPEGALDIMGTENDATHDYQWHLYGKISPEIIQPFLTEKAAHQFENFTFNEPADLNADISGRLYDYDSIAASGHASLKEFSIRGEMVDQVETDFRYAHRVAEFLQPRLEAGAQKMQADGVRLDWPGDRIYFTNGLGTADPQQVANAIGPIPAQDLQYYHFLALPTARVNGYAPLRDPTNADLDFQVVGTTPLGWYKLKTRSIGGEIHWVGQTLILTNMAGSFYGGSGQASAFFDFKPHKGANFSFTADLQNVDLHSLATDLSSPTNHLDGSFAGHFVVTRGYSGDWRTCDGYGYASLRDGLIWDVPIFGLLSPVLNTVSPGLGNSRATDASAQFIMTNGVVSTDHLIIHTTIMRLIYNGSVDLQGNLNADVTAELFRDVPGVGQVLSTVAWPAAKIFESKVTGTWKNPRSKPIYIPKIFLYMIHPFQTLEDIKLSQPQPNEPNQ